MKIGMLWFDNDPKADLKLKIERAAGYYSKKYGHAPNVCFMHPSMMPVHKNGETEMIELRSNRSILPNHFWIGMAESSHA
jgi:hypothetical protein